MGNDLTTTEGYLTASDLQRQSNMIKEILKNVLVKDVHYGVPFAGSPKQTLLKPGAEKILTTFRIAVDPETEDLSTPDEIRYRVKCKGVSILTGNLIGVGIGECSSSEEKYKWKKPVCLQEFDETPSDRKREKWIKSYNNFEKIQQIRTNPSDIANTILKMAKKRAQADLTLTATAASDIFDAPEYDDMPEEPTDTDQTQKPEAKKPMEPPKRKSEAPQAPSKDIFEIILSGDASEVTEKEGEKNGKKYMIYYVSAPEGKFASFSDTVAETVRNCIKGNLEYKLKYIKDSYGNKIESVEIVGATANV